MRVKNKTTPATWFFRYYEDRNGRRVHRNLKIGTVRDLPLRRDAEKAVLSLRSTINSEAVSYTHLDVYKRQVLGNARVMGGSVVARTLNSFPFANGFRAVPITELG